MMQVLAVDPGREKCGVAVVDQALNVAAQTVVPADQLLVTVRHWVCQYGCRTLVLGDGTAAESIRTGLATLTTEQSQLQIISVNEKNSTQAARARYWQANPPQNWRRFVPLGLLTPPCAIDDFAAIILAERYFENCAKNQQKNI